MDEHEAGYETQRSVAEATCSHHWLIEPPKGPTSMGVCKLCGATKEFQNQLKSSGLIAPSSPGREPMTIEEESGDEEF